MAMPLATYVADITSSSGCGKFHIPVMNAPSRMRISGV